LTITTISTTEGSHDTSKGSHDTTEIESHDTTITPTLDTNLRGPPVIPVIPETIRGMSRSFTLPDTRRDLPGSPVTESFDESSYSDSLHDQTNNLHDPTDSLHDQTDNSSHDQTDSSHDPIDSSHNPTERSTNRAAILDIIYQQYIRETKSNSGKGTRGTRKKVINC